MGRRNDPAVAEVEVDGVVSCVFVAVVNVVGVKEVVSV